MDKKSANKAFIGACTGGWIDIVQMLMNQDFKFPIPLYAAAKCGQIKVIQYLLQKLKDSDINIGKMSSMFQIALEAAVKGGHLNY